MKSCLPFWVGDAWPYPVRVFVSTEMMGKWRDAVQFPGRNLQGMGK